ncbi:MAG: DUF2157 domain-containing protein [Runella sp.]
MRFSTYFLDLWQKQGLLTPDEQQRIQHYEQNRAISVYWLLQMVLYIGLLLFTTGAGMLIYLNIDTIGHEALIAALAVITMGCFYYVYRHRQPFSWGEVNHEGKFADIALLLACTLFLSLEGYVQWRYEIFGIRYGLATFMPAVLFLYLAYRFDHRGVLSMGLTALASWVGLSVAPLEVLSANDFGNAHVINTAVIFGVLVVGLALWLDTKGFKKHFTFTYLLLAGNLLFVAALAGMFSLPYWPVFGVVVGTGAWFFFRYAQRTRSFLFLLMAFVYGYIAVTYLVFKYMNNDLLVLFGTFYVAASAAVVIAFLLGYKKLLSPTEPPSVKP